MRVEDSELEKWLRKNYISSIDFCKQVGCSKVTLWKIKRGIEVSSSIAEKVFELTKGKVRPKTIQKKK